MANICIVTVCESINVGSFWQAYILGDFFALKGHNVFYYRQPKRIKRSWLKIRAFFGMIVRGQIEDAPKYLKSLVRFRKAQKEFKFIPYHKNIDLYVIGSDVVWNINDQFFKKNIKLYTGGKFKEKSYIFYGTSISGSDSSYLINNKNFKNGILLAQEIGVRDLATNKVVTSSGRESTLVCDPTMLYSKNQYKPFLKGLNGIKEDYVFIYLFTPLNKSHENELLRFAKKHNLRLISAYKRNNAKYADQVIMNNPRDFLKYMFYAKYVVTDTFHGTIFPINFNISFVSIDKGKVPVNDIISRLNLEERLINDNISVENALEKAIDWERVNSKLDIIRNESIKFLEESIASIIY